MFANQFEFFIVLKCSSVIHLTQFVQLLQCQLGFTKVAQARLRVILCHILIGLGTFFVNFIKNHTGIYTPGAGLTPGAAAPGVAPPMAPAPIGDSMPAGVRSDSSSPAAMSLSIPAGVTPMLRKS